MKTIDYLRGFLRKSALVFSGILFVCSLLSANEMTQDKEENSGYAFPLEFSSADNDTTYTIYSPQLGEWDGFTLTGISAVSVRDKGAVLPTYGMISFSVQTETDSASQTVRLEDFKITDANFPSIGNKTDAWVSELEQNIPKQFSNLPLDAVKEVIVALHADQSGVYGELRNDPPKIVLSTTPTVLIPIDGDPQWVSVGSDGLERVVNTQVLLLRDKSGYLLHFWDGYIRASALNGPWSAAVVLPKGVEAVEKLAVESGQVDLLQGEEDDNGISPSLITTPIPDVYVSTEPTELILCDGEPQWNPIPGTQLLYISNTPSYVFKELKSQETYVLLSGRWFESKTFEGPWRYVPSSELPEDFANIPDDSPQEVVKAAVAGTQQAKEAVIASLIPETVRVERDSTKLENEPDYGTEGPQLKAIEDTTLHYVINSNTPIIKVNANSWYACENGVWYFSNSAYGPWVVATSIPAEIYRIPVSCPIYYVSYVRLYRWSGNYVWFGYTPGYYGTIIGPYGTVVYGTGYYYRPYISSSYYVSYPISYGYAINPCWTPWYGWSVGFSFGYSYYWGRSYYRPRPPAPYWGPYRHHFYGRNHPSYVRAHRWNDVRWDGRDRPGGRQFDNRRPNISSSAQVRPSDRDRFNGIRYNSRTGRPVDPRRNDLDTRVRITQIQNANRDRGNEYNTRSSGMTRPSGMNPPDRDNRRPENVNTAPTRQGGRNIDNYTQERRDAGGNRTQVRPDAGRNSGRNIDSSRLNENVRRENVQLEERIRLLRERQAQATREQTRRPQNTVNVQPNRENPRSNDRNTQSVERPNRTERTDVPRRENQNRPRSDSSSVERPQRQQNSSETRSRPSQEMRDQRRNESSGREGMQSRPVQREETRRNTANVAPREQRPERPTQQVQPRENPRPQEVRPPPTPPQPVPTPNNNSDSENARPGRRR